MFENDIFFVSATVLVALLTFLCQVTWIIPELYSHYLALWYLAILFIAYQFSFCFWKVAKQNTSVRGRFLPGTLLPNWKYCHYCQLNQPPRAYHCDRCNVCILKRCHHCIYTGSCIGYFNQRYFIILLFWSLVGCTIATCNNLKYLFGHTQMSTFAHVLFFFLPMLSYGFGLTDMPFMFAMHYTSTFYSVATTFALLVYQMILIYRNQTLHEWRTGDETYSSRNYGKMLRNLKSVFGSGNLLLTLIFPFKAGPMESDGLYTSETVMAEHGKFT